MDKCTEISVNQIGIKCKSKKEVYNLLTTEGGYYLPPCRCSLQIHIANPCWNQEGSEIKGCQSMHGNPSQRINNTRDTPICKKSILQLMSLFPVMITTSIKNRDWIWNFINTSWQVEFQNFI